MPNFPSSAHLSCSTQIRKIIPPKLAEHHVGKRILCHRPMRRGSPAMYVENINDKIIAHNYGHGGSGWTLGPGATAYVIKLLQNEISKNYIQKEEPIAIIGAGIIGFLSALAMLNQGYTDITIYAESFDNLASHNAGAILAPVSMENDASKQNLINKMGAEGYRFYKNIAEGKNSQFAPSGVNILPAYFENRQDSMLEHYVGVVMEPANDVILDFGNGMQRKMIAYDDAIFLHTHLLMEDLNRLLKDKIRLVKRKIQDINILQQRIVLNCTGTGAKFLAKDDEMVSVQGHLLMLKQQNPSHINHMIVVPFDKGKTKSNFNVKRYFYLLPKKLLGSPEEDVGVIGGTYIEGADENAPHEEEFEIMLEIARRFYGLT